MLLEGFGMNVAYMPCFRATSLTVRREVMMVSAIVSASV